MAVGGTPRCPHCGMSLYTTWGIDMEALKRLNENPPNFDLEAMWDVPPLTFDIEDFD